jgi:hypothetical protein
VYDFTDGDGRSVIAVWRSVLTARSKAQFDQKINMLATAGMDLPPKLLAGPINKTRHIYKLKIHADVMLRPMLCKGPFAMNDEFTLLVGAKEVQNKLIPDPSVAVENREILLKYPERRVPRVR